MGVAHVTKGFVGARIQLVYDAYVKPFDVSGRSEGSTPKSPFSNYRVGVPTYVTAQEMAGWISKKFDVVAMRKLGVRGPVWCDGRFDTFEITEVSAPVSWKEVVTLEQPAGHTDLMAAAIRRRGRNGEPTAKERRASEEKEELQNDRLRKSGLSPEEAEELDKAEDPLTAWLEHILTEHGVESRDMVVDLEESENFDHGSKKTDNDAEVLEVPQPPAVSWETHLAKLYLEDSVCYVLV